MSNRQAFLPYGRQSIDDDDIAAVTAVLRGDFLTTGPVVERFEEALARKVGARHAVACSSGTAALHLATLGLGLGPGDICIVPAVTFLATANACRFVGASVVFADVDPDTGLVRPEDVEQALERAGERARAVLPVHLAGQSADMAAIAALARSRNLLLIEDACHALGTDQLARSGDVHPVGACADSDAAAFSFHPVKAIAMGEGGAVTTNDPNLARRMTRLRNHGMVREPDSFIRNDLALDADGQVNRWYYEMPEVGFNYRASDIHCALGLSQLGKLDRLLDRRRSLVAAYDTALKPLAPLVRPLVRPPGNLRVGWHLYVALIDFERAGLSRNRLVTRLQERGIGTQVHYIPLHLQPYYRTEGAAPLPGAEAYYARCLSLPLHPGMTPADVDRVVAMLAECLSSA